jgi:aldose 1-epimerase
MALTGTQFTINAGDHQATVVEVGAGLRRYVHRGADVIASYGESDLPPRGAGAVLVPWPNRLRSGRYAFLGRQHQLPINEVVTGNAIHGLGRWVRWTPKAVDAAAVTLALDIAPQAGWPFEVRVEITYALHPDYGLGVTAVARNHGVTRAPFGAGFHPYLALGGAALGDVALQIPAAQRLVTDEAQLPVGTQAVSGTPYDLSRGRKLGGDRLDDAFTALSTVDGRGAAEVRAGSAATRLWFDETFRYLQVFTVEALGDGAPAVAVEPMTCPADAFNSGSGLIVLEPGGMWTGSWGIEPLPR